MSQDLQTARYDQFVRRIGGLYGGGSKVTEALAELFPVLEMENTTPELLTLTGWRTCWQNIEQAALAGQTSAVSLTNPLGSNLIAAVTQVNFKTNNPDNIQMQFTNTLLVSAAISGLYRDARFGDARRSVCQLRSDNNVPTGAGVRMLTIANQIEELRDDNGLVVLTPGSAFQVGTTGNNLLLAVNYFWRERIAEPSELLFP